MSDKLLDALKAAGLVADDGNDHITRVVIDLQTGCAPVIHTQRWGDERLLKLIPGLDGIEITREEDR